MIKVATILLVSSALVSCTIAAALPSIEVVSKPSTNIPHVFGDSTGIELSADGKWAVFNSNGNGLATNDNNGLNLDLFLRNNQTGEITLITRNTSGASADGDSIGPIISADGRFVVFQSTADDLVPGDDNESDDVFLYDRDTGKISVVSKSSRAVANGQSGTPVMTPDARFILFESDADDLSPIDNNGVVDLYLLDRNSGELKLVTDNANGTAAASSDYSFLGQFEGGVSGDGRFVAYLSYATNVVPKFPANTGDAQLFLRDMVAGTNIWLSKTTNGVAASAVSTPTLSRDGAYLAFLSAKITGQGSTSPDTYLYVYATSSGVLTEVQPATEFGLSADGHWIAYISDNVLYLYETATGAKTQVHPEGDPGNDVASSPVISDEGSTILFTSASTNLVNGVSGTSFQLFRYDRASKQLILLSRGLSGSGGANSDVIFPVVSGDGSAAGFMSYATNLVATDDKGGNDVFIVATSGTNSVTLASTPDARVISQTGYGRSTLGGAISADGRFVAFTSDATDLVPNDNNDASDVFLRDLKGGVTKLVSISPDGIHPLAAASHFFALSADGATVAFTSSNLFGTNQTQSVFIHDVNSGTNTVATLLPNGDLAANATSGAMSTDGRYFVFQWKDPNQTGTGVYLRDLATQTTILVTNPVFFPFNSLAISPKGKYVLAASGIGRSLSLIDWKNHQTISISGISGVDALAPAVVTEDESHLLMHITVSGTPLLTYYSIISGASNTVAVSPWAWGMSQDGSTIAYQTKVTNNHYRVFIYDTVNGVTSGVPGTDSDQLLRDSPVLNADGRYVLFETSADLTGAGTNGRDNIFAFDRWLTNLTLVSHALSGAAGDEGSSNPSVSADGRTIAFQSSASDLVLDDRNLASDVFVARLPIADSDQNSLEDGWEIANFGGTGVDPRADPDKDGMSNLQEYLAGTNPKDPTSALAVQSVRSTGDGALHLQWQGVAGKRYQLQFRSAFGSGDWQNVGSPMLGAAEPLVTTAAVGANGAGFYRVELLP